MIRGKFRSYILISDRLTRGKACAAVAQAVAKLMEEYTGTSCLRRWTTSDYNKAICVVTNEQRKQAKQRADRYISIFEDDVEIATIFVPRKRWHRMFTYLTLFGTRSHHAKKPTIVNITVNYDEPLNLITTDGNVVADKLRDANNWSGMGGYDL